MKNIIFRKDNVNEYIDSYWIAKYKSGIIHLLINTADRWIEYHRYNNNTFGFFADSPDEIILEIKELNIPVKHLPLTIQEKDQISFYWVPYKLLR